MKPRNLKQAIEQGYKIVRVYGRYDKEVRVMLVERYHKPNRAIAVQFWINRAYFERNYSYPTA